MYTYIQSQHKDKQINELTDKLKNYVIMCQQLYTRTRMLYQQYDTTKQQYQQYELNINTMKEIYQQQKQQRQFNNQRVHRVCSIMYYM